MFNRYFNISKDYYNSQKKINNDWNNNNCRDYNDLMVFN